MPRPDKIVETLMKEVMVMARDEMEMVDKEMDGIPMASATRIKAVSTPTRMLVMAMMNQVNVNCQDTKAILLTSALIILIVLTLIHTIHLQGVE
jgi:hypothetical protein